MCAVVSEFRCQFPCQKRFSAISVPDEMPKFMLNPLAIFVFSENHQVETKNLSAPQGT